MISQKKILEESKVLDLISITKLAKRSGTTRKTIHLILNGKNCSEKTWKKIYDEIKKLRRVV